MRLHTKIPLPQSVGDVPSQENPISQLDALAPHVRMQGIPVAQSNEHDVASHSMAHVASLPLQSSEQLEVVEPHTTEASLSLATTSHNPDAAHCTEQSGLSEHVTSQLLGLLVQVKAADEHPRHSRSHDDELSQVGAHVVPMLHRALHREPVDAQSMAGQSQPHWLQAYSQLVPVHPVHPAQLPHDGGSSFSRGGREPGSQTGAPPVPPVPVVPPPPVVELELEAPPSASPRRSEKSVRQAAWPRKARLLRHSHRTRDDVMVRTVAEASLRWDLPPPRHPG